MRSHPPHPQRTMYSTLDPCLIEEDEDVGSETARPSNAHIEQLLKQDIDMEDTPNVLVTDNSAATTDFKRHIAKTNNQTN